MLATPVVVEACVRGCFQTRRSHSVQSSMVKLFSFSALSTLLSKTVTSTAVAEWLPTIIVHLLRKATTPATLVAVEVTTEEGSQCIWLNLAKDEGGCVNSRASVLGERAGSNCSV